MAVGALAVGALATAAAAALVISRLRDNLPPANRVVAVEVTPADAARAPALPDGAPAFDQAAAWVFRQQWRRLEVGRRFRISDDGGGNVSARVVWEPAGERVRVRLEVGASVRRRQVAEVTADSLREAAELLFPALSQMVGRGQPEVELFPEEQEQMREIAAPSVAAYREAIAVINEYNRVIAVDAAPLMQRLDALIAQHPDWAQIVAMRAWTLGVRSPRTQQLVDSHLALARASGRDPFGIRLLEATRAANPHASGPTGAIAIDHRNNPMLGSWLSNDLESDGAVAALSDYSRRFPHLQWAVLTWNGYSRAGLATAARQTLLDWLSRAPGQEQAWLTLALTCARDGGSGSLATVERALVTLHGRTPSIQLGRATIHLARFELEAAAAAALPLLSEPSIFRANALYLLGEVELLSGHFERAYERFLGAWEFAIATHLEGDFIWIQCARELAGLAARLRRPADTRRWRAELTRWMEEFTWSPAVRAAASFEARADSSGCPDMASAVAWTAEGSERREAERLVERVAARLGCAPCTGVLAAGAASDESMLPWTVEFARCAVADRSHLDQVLRVLARADFFESPWISSTSDPSGMDVALATYWIGRAQELKGNTAGARTHYQRFLSFWESADVRVPEVDEARSHLQRLQQATSVPEARPRE